VTPATQPPWLESVVNIITELYPFRGEAHLPRREYFESASSEPVDYIGYRHHGMDVKEGQVITKDEGIKLLETDLQILAQKLDDLLPCFNSWYPQVKAIVVSLAFDQGFNDFRLSRLGKDMATTWHGCNRPLLCVEEYYQGRYRNFDNRRKRLADAHGDLEGQLRDLQRSKAKAKREAERIAKRAALKAKREKAAQPHRSGLSAWRLGQRDKLQRKRVGPVV
jgi:hypothetical protein